MRGNVQGDNDCRPFLQPSSMYELQERVYHFVYQTTISQQFYELKIIFFYIKQIIFKNYLPPSNI